MIFKSVTENLKDYNSPFRLTAITAAIYFLYIFAFLYFNHFSMSSFICFGEKFIEQESRSIHSIEKISSTGYDGQFFYRLALDPFTQKATDFGITIDNPPYRQQRILYPLIVWLLSAGNPSSTIYILVLINYLSICGITFVSAKLFQQLNSDSVIALIVSFYPGFLISLSRSLCEPLAIFFMFLSLYLFIKKQYLTASIVLSLAILTRETTLIVAVGASLYWFKNLFRKDRVVNDQIPIFFFLIPICTYVCWQFYLFHIWEVFPVLSTKGGTIGEPFNGLILSLLSFLSFQGIHHLIYIIEIIWIFIFIACCAFLIPGTVKLFAIVWVLYALMSLTFSAAIWNNHHGFYRALMEFQMFGILIIALSKLRVKYAILSIWPLFWLISAIWEIAIQKGVPFISLNP